MKKVISVLLCIMWMIFIFFNSAQTGESSNNWSYKIVDKIISIEQIFKDNTKTNSESSFNNNENGKNNIIVKASKNTKNNKRIMINKVLRKIAHAVEYFILAILFANMFFCFGLKGKKAVIYILFGVLFYAVLDELHQLYIPKRESSVVDVLIDFAGGLLGLIVYYLGYYSFIKKRK
ncbi:MAG: teicoplanin resistance protein VanZ [Clostridium sp.]|nr:teicoplanin resistance protein VanZ [Clostridium sp.]